MRALLEDLKSGQVAAYDVPAPELQERGILVRTAFSAISSGTEKATVEAGRKSLLGKAMARPDLVRQVLPYAQSNGVRPRIRRCRRVWIRSLPWATPVLAWCLRWARGERISARRSCGLRGNRLCQPF